MLGNVEVSATHQARTRQEIIVPGADFGKNSRKGSFKNGKKFDKDFYVGICQLHGPRVAQNPYLDLRKNVDFFSSRF